MQGNYNTSIKVGDDLTLSTDALAKLQHALKNKINVKTCRNHKEL